MTLTIKNVTVKVSLLICLSFFSFSVSRAQQVNFSGNWKLDRTKTDFGELSENSTPVQLIINQQQDDLTIERFSKNSHGETHSYKEKLPFKGGVIETMIRTTKKTATIKWGPDKQTIVESAEYTDDSAPDDFKAYKATETWILSTDGKTLTVARVDEFTAGREPRKIVYQKL